MLEGIEAQRLLHMTAHEKRWLNNVKKALYESDRALQSGLPEDRCLEELFKGVDTAKTLRRSLRGEDTSPRDHKKRFIEFLALEIPCAGQGGSTFPLVDARRRRNVAYSFGEIVYEIRCMIHENENLNAAEDVDYHILLDWSVRNPQFYAQVCDGMSVFNGYFLWNRLREVLSKFITGIEGMIASAEGRPWFISCRPDLGSIAPASQRSKKAAWPRPPAARH